MKVYTHYFSVPGSKTDGFRWRTILQFGNSWEIIGSVVMKNPGGADFKDENPITTPDILNKLKTFDDGTLNGDWFEFRSDSTMNCIAKLFAEYQNTNFGKPLNGVVQIFNLFYIRETDLSRAIEKASKVGNCKGLFKDKLAMAEYDIAHLVPPIYLGFAALAWHKTYGVIAEMFFHAAKEKGMDYLSDDFHQNAFVHPQYMMLFGRNRAKCINARCQFLQNTQQPIIPAEYLHTINNEYGVKLNNALIVEQLSAKLLDMGYRYSEEKNHRFILGCALELTLMSKNGEIGIRHYLPKPPNYLKAKQSNEYEMRSSLEELGFDTQKNEKNCAWLGRKSFLLYGNDERSVISAVVQELVTIEKSLNKLYW